MQGTEQPMTDQNLSNKIQTIILDDDIIEIFHNPMLSTNPYLIRFFSYNSRVHEIRASHNDIQELSAALNECLSIVNPL